MADALRAEWYDLDKAAEADFLGWLHDDMLPKLASQPGVSWVGHYRIAEKPASPMGGSAPARRETTEAVPPGRQFFLLTCATADRLLNRDPAVLELESDPRLAARLNWRDATFIEESRINGPAAAGHDRDHCAPPAMQMGNFVIASPAAERDMALYYRRHRFRQVEATPGCIGARKFVSTVGWPKHGILYEFNEMFDGDILFETRMNAALPQLRWTGAHPLDLVIHAPHAPHAGRRIWPPA